MNVCLILKAPLGKQTNGLRVKQRQPQDIRIPHVIKLLIYNLKMFSAQKSIRLALWYFQLGKNCAPTVMNLRFFRHYPRRLDDPCTSKNRGKYTILLLFLSQSRASQPPIYTPLLTYACMYVHTRTHTNDKPEQFRKI